MRPTALVALAACALAACGGRALDGAHTNAGANAADAAKGAGPDGGTAACTPVLASDYDQTCAVDSDCVLVGELSCPVEACACLTHAVNASVAAAYMAALHAGLATTPAPICSCPAECGVACVGGLCGPKSCFASSADAGPRDAGAGDATPDADAGPCGAGMKACALCGGVACVDVDAGCPFDCPP